MAGGDGAVARPCSNYRAQAQPGARATLFTCRCRKRCRLMRAGHIRESGCQAIPRLAPPGIAEGAPPQVHETPTQCLFPTPARPCRYISATASRDHGSCAASRTAAALNPRVRGSSPWRRTRTDLGFYYSRSFFRVRFVPMAAPWLLARMDPAIRGLSNLVLCRSNIELRGLSLGYAAW